MSTEADTTSTLLDLVDKIVIPGEPLKNPSNEFWALICLWNGLEYLNNCVENCEQTVRSHLSPNNGHFLFGGFPGIDDSSLSLITSAFHWYAVSACNLTRLIGSIAKRIDNSRPKPPEYTKSVLPEVLGFRDKVAAHFAWTGHNNYDNTAERQFSVMPQLTFEHDAFFVGGMQLHISHGEADSNSKAIAKWSLTKVHLQLRQRYKSLADL